MAATDVERLEATAAWVGADSFVNQATQIASSFGLIADSADKATQRQLATGLAAAGGAALIVGALGRAALAAGEEDAAFARAATTFRSYGNSFPIEEIRQLATEQQRLTGVADDSIAGFVGLLGSFNLTEQQAKQLTPAILDASEALKAQGVTAESLAVGIGKAIQAGNVQGLRRMGVVVDEADVKRLGAFQAVLQAVARQGQGAAGVFRDSLPGAIQAAKNSFGDLVESVGGSVAPVFRAVAEGVNTVSSAVAAIPGAGAAIAGGLAVGAAALTFYSAQTLLAVRNTVLLAQAQLQGAAAARAQAAAQGQAAAATAASGASAGGAGVGQAASAAFAGLRTRALIGTGILGAGAAAAGGLAGSAIVDATKGTGGATAGLIGGGALQGAGAGAGIGMFFGPIGAAIGAGVGAAAGAIIAAQAGASERATLEAMKDAPVAANPELEELRKIVQTLTQQNQILRGISTGAPMDSRGAKVVVPEAEMARAIRGMVGG